MKNIIRFIFKGITIILFALLIGVNIQVGNGTSFASNDISVFNEAEANDIAFCKPVLDVCTESADGLVILGDLIVIPITIDEN